MARLCGGSFLGFLWVSAIALSPVSAQPRQNTFTYQELEYIAAIARVFPDIDAALLIDTIPTGYLMCDRKRLGHTLDDITQTAVESSARFDQATANSYIFFNQAIAQASIKLCPNLPEF
jgi:hypothetical protein